jgi:hypothetical protein
MRNKSRRVIAFHVLFGLLCASPAAAYIDPGTGSALFYVVTGFLVSAYFAVRSGYYSLIEFAFSRRIRRERCVVALHSEDSRYESTFLPILRVLSARGVPVTYITMYTRDASFESLPAGITHLSIPPGLIGYSYLNHLEAQVFATTTPQLDVMMFRRSPLVGAFLHLPHALGEGRFVRPYAYDFFDAVGCCGPLLERNIRTIEKKRGFATKRLFRTGVPHYESLIRDESLPAARPERRRILVAPSWGPLSLFARFGTDFIAPLALRYDVTVRPHPQMRLSQPDLFARVLATPGVDIDTSRSPAEALAAADLMISDFSGIIHEFSLLYEKPVIFVDAPHDLGGFDGYLLDDVDTLRVRCASFVTPLDPEKFDSLGQLIDSTLARTSRDEIRGARSELLYRLGDASEACVEAIEKLLAEQRALSVSQASKSEADSR